MFCKKHVCYEAAFKRYRDKDCIETFIKRLYAMFPQQPMTELPVYWKEHEATETCFKSVLKCLMTQRIKRYRSSPPKVFIWKGVLKICSKFTGEHLCPKCDFNKVVKLHIFRTPFPRNTCEWLLVEVTNQYHDTSLYREAVPSNCNLTYRIHAFL